MTEITNQLIFETLKQIQETLADIKTTQAKHSRQLVRLHEELNEPIILDECITGAASFPWYLNQSE